MKSILTCRFPFPPHDPPLQMPESCLDRCPNDHPELLRPHATIACDDAELLASIRDFLDWFYAPDQPNESLDEQRRRERRSVIAVAPPSSNLASG